MAGRTQGLVSKHGRSGYTNHGCRCDICATANRNYMSRYGQTNADKLRTARKKWAIDNADRLKAYQHQKYLQNADVVKARSKAQREANPEAFREYLKRWTAENRDHISAYHKLKRIENPAPYRARNRRYQQKQSTKVRRRVNLRAYRARRAGAAGMSTIEQIQARWNYFGGLCWMCRRPATSMDHLIPLSRGGSNWPSNFRPACRKCNSSKGTKTPSEYYQAKAWLEAHK